MGEKTRETIKMSTVSLALFAFWLSTPTVAKQTEATDKLAASAGYYLGGLDIMRVLHGSECGYAVARRVMTPDTAMATEILPAFSPDSRAWISRQVQAAHTEMTNQSESVVRQSIDAGLQKFDQVTTCDRVAVALAGVFSKAEQEWFWAKRKYGYTK